MRPCRSLLGQALWSSGPTTRWGGYPWRLQPIRPLGLDPRRVLELTTESRVDVMPQTRGQHARPRPRSRSIGAAVVLLLLASPGNAASAEVQLRCEGTLLEARGTAERQRPAASIAFSLGLEARGASADRALELLQVRLTSVRATLKRLGVRDLRVGSPSTWSRPAAAGERASFQSDLAVSGTLDPQRLQGLVREVGGLPGIRLSPVTAEADPAAVRAGRSALLAAAYRDAEAQVRPLAALIGHRQLRPLQIQVEGGAGPMMMRAEMAPPAPPAFDPAELPLPTERLTLLVQFCAMGASRRG